MSTIAQRRKNALKVYILAVIVMVGLLFAIGLPDTSLKVEKVAVLGDSLVFGASTDLDTALKKIGYKPNVQGYPGYTLDAALAGEQMQANKPLESIVATKPDAVVIALGSNDSREFVATQNSANPSLALTQRTMRTAEVTKQMLSTLANVPCVVFVGTQEDTTEIGLSTYGATINVQIRRQIEASTQPHRHFLNWADVMRPHPQYQAADNLHFSPEGSLAYAQAIALEVQSRCV